MPFLIVRQPGQVVFSVPVRGEIRLGRDAENDLVLSDSRVSRQHCRIAADGVSWVLTDLGSTHGTLVGSVRVGQRALCDGDQIQIGDVLLSFALEDLGGDIAYQQPTGDGTPTRRGRPDRRLQVLHEVGRAIDAAREADELLARILDAVLDVFGCERAMAGLREHDAALDLSAMEAMRSLRRVVRARGTGGRSEAILSRDVLEALLDRREALIVRSKVKGGASQGIARERPPAAMGAPLALGQRVLGFLYVEHREQSERFTPEDLDFLVALAHLTAAALESIERYQRAMALAEAMGAGTPARKLLGESQPMQRLRVEVQRLGNTTKNVLIRGETGTGKELVARSLHAASPRAEQPWVAVNCSAIPEAMIESELFGHERGAFTDAAKSRRGKFTLAHRGTLFLDEIGDLSLSAQAKVLRAIQEGEIQPLGAERTSRVDVRILSATHKDLTREIAEGKFREDLYYRISVLEIVVPALRDRSDDIEILARTLLQSEAASTRKHFQGFTPQALAALRRYRWPGNVRELQRVVARATVHAESALIDVVHLDPMVQAAISNTAWNPSGGRGLSFAERDDQLKMADRELVEEVLRETKWNVSEAARRLGISWIVMKRRIKSHKLKSGS